MQRKLLCLDSINMIKHLKILLLSLIFYSCCAQKVSEVEIYEALGSIIVEMEGEKWVERGKLDFQYILDKSFQKLEFLNRIEILLDNETITKHFSIEDLTGFEAQLEFCRDFAYQQNKIQFKKVLPKRELEDILLNDRKSFWEVYIERYGNIGFYDISFLLFSIDKRKMLVSVEQCYPYLNGGAVYLFTKVNGAWKIKEILFTFT